jgi:hypothetical protein
VAEESGQEAFDAADAGLDLGDVLAGGEGLDADAGDVGLELVQRTLGHDQEPREVARRAIAVAFGDVSWNRLARPTDLIRQRRSLPR